MRLLALIISTCCACTALLSQHLAAEELPSDQNKGKPAMTNVLSVNMKSLANKDVQLNEQYKGKVVLLVNVASKCGLTPQYKQLEALFQEKGKNGFAIAAFPCNQFGAQEPGTAEEIQTFCKMNYGVSFDLFAKIDVNGDAACALYKALTSAETKPVAAGPISWNFEKFLIGKDGSLIGRFGPKTAPNDAALVAAIDKALAE